MSDSADTLLVRAKNLLNLNQQGLGEAVGVSRRTIQRWFDVGGTPSDALIRLAPLVISQNPDLAADLATAAGTSLQALGLAPAPTPAAAVESLRGPFDSHLVESVVCAGADALNLSPRLVRPALLEAFARAQQTGLTLEAVIAELRRAIETPA